MGKAGRWLRSILAGKKKDGGIRGRERKALPQPQPQGDATPLPATSAPREKKRWSFRRPSAQGKAAAAPSPLSQEPSKSVSGCEVDEQREQAEEVAADAAVMAAAQEAVAVARLTEAEGESDVLAIWLVEEAAAARIQATFRGYLARKALCALRGLVKLQALVRGQLVRRQANATLRRMQALVSAQSRLRAQRTRMLDQDQEHPAAAQRRSPQHPRRRSSYEMDRSGEEEHVKIVEMDPGEPARRGRSSCSAVAGESRERRLAEYYYHYGQCSPAPSSAAFAELLSPRTCNGHLDELLALDPATAPGLVPSYMANTESSRAKARSQSAPRQRSTDALERQPSRRRGGGAPRKTMQRSASHIGVPATAAACGYPYQYQYPPWAGVRLDQSSASLVGSECGSSSSVLTAATTVGGYGRPLVGFEVHRAHY